MLIAARSNASCADRTNGWQRLTVAVACPCGRHATGFESTVIQCGGCARLFIVGVTQIGGTE